MKPVTLRSGAARGRWRRAATMLEFALILPIFMFIMLFTIDMGHLTLMSGAVQNATYSSALAGAQVGGASVNNTSETALLNAIEQIPGDGSLGHLSSWSIEEGSRCTGSGSYVAIESRYTTDLLTPGLGAMLKLMSGSDQGVSDTGWTLTSTATVRCQVVR